MVEEAQSVLNEKASAATPYIEWVKEGREYDLSAVLITQQPGSIFGDGRANCCVDSHRFGSTSTLR